MRKLAFAAVLGLGFGTAWAQHGSSAQNMTLLGHQDLQARSAYQPLVRENHGRWIAYVGHHGGKTMNPLTGREEDSGTSIVDVTDPRNPKYLKWVPGPENTWDIQVTLHDNLMITAMQQYGPDSFVGRLACIFQGTTDSTFYIVALYFGSIGISKTRYTVPVSLLADLSAIITAILISYLFFTH